MTLLPLHKHWCEEGLFNGEGCTGDYWWHEDASCEEGLEKPCPLCDGKPNGDQARDQADGFRE